MPMRTFTRRLPLIAALVVSQMWVSWIAPPKASTLRQGRELPALVFVEAFQVVRGELSRRFPEGSRLVRYDPQNPANPPTNLTPNFFAAADPRVSGSGKEILFSAQVQRESTWQIWEMKADGSGQHQLVECPGDCFQAAYLPRGEIAFTVVTGNMGQPASAVYVGKSDGTQVHAITFGPGNFQVETVLHDGRILVSAESMLVPEPRGPRRRSLFVLNPDGTGLTAFRRAPALQSAQPGAEELADGTVLFAKRENLAGQRSGNELAMVIPGALRDSAMARSSSSIWSAHQLDGNALVVAKQNLDSPLARSRFDLYAFDLANKTFGPLIYRHPSLSSVQAVALEGHPPPKFYWSILHPESKVGRAICLNVHLSADAPQGRLADDITQVRVLSLQDDQKQQVVLGDAPVESDGSFYLAAPADRPVRFELLNAKGAVVKVQRSWIWVRPGEDRACLGCHADPALTPANHWALALKRASGPTLLASPAGTQPAHH